MSRFVRSRRAAAAAGVAAAVAVGPLAVSAAAADEYQSPVEVYAPDTLSVAPDAPGGKTLRVDLWTQGSGAKDVVLTLDTSGLAGVADVAFPKQCTTKGATATCKVGDIPVPANGDISIVALPIKVTAAKGALPGAKGTINYTKVTQANAPAGTPLGGTRIVVNSGYDLTAADLPSQIKAQPGGTIDMPVAFSNQGNTPVKGIAIVMAGEDGITFAARHKNCNYSGDAATGQQAVCHFPDVTAAPGASYSLPSPEKMQLAKDVTYAAQHFAVVAEADLPNVRDPKFPEGKAGDGPEVKLQESKPAVTRKAVELNDADNWTGSQVYTGLEIDLAAVGTSVSGKAGSTVTARVGMENRGPGRLMDRSGGESDISVKVVLPEGVSVAKAPDNCAPSDGTDLDWRNGQPRFPGLDNNGRAAFVCWWKGDYWQYPVGAKGLFAFDLKIDKVVPDAKGGIQITKNRNDKTEADNRAELVVNPTGGTGATGGATAGNQPGNGGPELAETGGSSSSTPVIAGVAGGLLVVAGGAFVVARRRKAAAAV